MSPNETGLVVGPSVEGPTRVERARRTECSGSLNVPAFSERECAAAHRLHAIHDSWSRTASDPRPEHCYQCHVYARRALEAAAKFDAFGAAG